MLDKRHSEIMEIIQNTLLLNPGVLKEISKAEEIENWDSLGHLSILVALDKHFNGKIRDIPQMATANSVPDIIKILEGSAII